MKYYKIISLWEFLVFLFSFFLSLFLLLYYFNGMNSSLTNKGIKFLEAKDFIQAQKHFNLALAKKPFNPWSYMNLALGYDFLEAPDKALKIYNIVSSHLKKKSNTAVFYSYFNKGELNGRLGQKKQALENYQKALEFRYKEKQIKQNIELLFQNNQQSQDQDLRKSKGNLPMKKKHLRKSKGNLPMKKKHLRKSKGNLPMSKKTKIP